MLNFVSNRQTTKNKQDELVTTLKDTKIAFDSM